MKSVLQIEGLTKSVGDRILFADFTLGIYEGDKIGIVARNGAGKTTLLRVLCGEEDYDSGRIIYANGVHVGFLSQNPPFNPDESVLDYASAGALQTGREEAAFTAKDLARQMLTQFGLTDLDRPMKVLSGGQLKRAALARVLLGEPDFLVLDEPTNHLDIPMVEWLEQYLSRSRATLLMVTHDRYFLDNVCNKILEIDQQQVFAYDGNFNYYLRRREERLENQQAELDRIKNLLRTELDWMRRQPQARGSKAKYRIDNFYDLKGRAQVNLSQKDVSLSVKGSYIGSKIFEARNVKKAFGDIPILNGWSYDFARYEKIGIVGPNGAGKSTFIKMLMGEIKPDSGSIDVGQTVRWGYYSQEGMVNFKEDTKVIDAVREIAEEVRIDDRTTLSASQFLSHFLFSYADQHKYVSKLSGGERRRLYLATVLMREPNFLVLDEPTNDLDIMTLTILEDYLVNFKGCVIVVSHDRFFLDRIADHLFVLRGNGEVEDFPGDYSTFREVEKELDRRRKAALSAEKTASDTQQQNRRSDRKPKLSFKEKKEMEELERLLPSLAEEKNALETQMSSGTMDHESLARAGARIEEIIARTDEAEMRLLELMEKEEAAN